MNTVSTVWKTSAPGKAVEALVATSVDTCATSVQHSVLPTRQPSQLMRVVHATRHGGIAIHGSIADSWLGYSTLPPHWKIQLEGSNMHEASASTAGDKDGLGRASEGGV